MAKHSIENDIVITKTTFTDTLYRKFVYSKVLRKV